MRKTILFILLTFCTIVISGCSLILEEPSTLIMPPVSSRTQYTERMLINKFLVGDEHLEVPEVMDEPAAFVNLDSDNDGENEKLIFWSNRNGYEVGAKLLKKNGRGEWITLDQIHQYGKNINYFKLVDINGDGSQEVCLGVDIGGYNTLYVYRLESGGFVDVDQLKYSKLEIVDLDDNGDISILCALNDNSEVTPTTSFYKYECGDTLKCVYQEAFDGNCVEMEFGNVGHNRKGVYYVHTNDYSYFNVELLLPSKEKQFEVQMSARTVCLSAVNGYNSLIEDVTGDGILDVYSVIEPVESTKRDIGDYVNVWKNWDGGLDLESVYGVLENNTDGYVFVLPNYCLDVLRYQFISEKGSSQVRFFDGDNEDASIILYAQNASEAEKIMEQEGIISLGFSPSHQRSYYALCNTDVFADHPIDETLIREAFQIEGGQ